MSRSNLVVAAAFLLFGIYLVASGVALPEGTGREPGPGFFPQVLGSITILLSLALFVETFRGREPETFTLRNNRALAGTAGLIFLYIALWGTGLFALRTAVFIALLLRFLGQRWVTSVAVGLIMSVSVFAAFQYGLRITLE